MYVKTFMYDYKRLKPVGISHLNCFCIYLFG